MPKKSLQGSLLLDGGKLAGSFFHRTVVLICKHDAEGAFGLILNRKTPSTVGDAIVANLPNTITGQYLFVGGPVQPAALSYLVSDSFLPNGNVMSNLNLGHTLDGLVEIGESYSTTQRLKLFSGYAGWDAGQLDREMARHDWLVHPATLDLIFHANPDELWKLILQEKGPQYKLLSEAPEDLSWN